MLRLIFLSRRKKIKLIIKKNSLKNLKGRIVISHCPGQNTVLVGFYFESFEHSTFVFVMSIDAFNNFKLQFRIICLDCLNEQKTHFLLGDFLI